MGTIIFQGDSVKGSIEEVFNIADKNLCCNTAYPVFKDEWKKYLSEQDIFADTHDISVYFHVPFCRQLCRFCEYTRFLAEMMTMRVNTWFCWNGRSEIFLHRS